jgi:hypothetical protein
MNIAYKHLDAKLRIAELSVGQWIGVLLGLAIGIGWGVYVSPFGPTLTLTSGIYLAALPAGAAFLGNITEFSPWLLIRSAIAWKRREGRFLPGPGASVHGYVVTAAGAGDYGGASPRATLDLDLATLWGESR